MALSVNGSAPTIGKALTTHGQVAVGIFDALRNATDQLDLDLHRTLKQTDVFLYGTTHATNAIVTSDTAKTALITTAGFADILRIREGGKAQAFDFRVQYPKPYVPRSLTYEVKERVTVDGSVHLPLDEGSVRAALGKAKSAGIEAVAVCLLWSVSNGAHEIRVGELIREELPGIPFSLSHEVNPVVREYRRASATSIDDSLSL